MKLSELAPGGRFVVGKIGVAGELGRRLADMGITEGSRGKLVRGSLLRGPIQIRLSGYDLLIRRGEAACIEVEPDEEAPVEAPSLGLPPAEGPAPLKLGGGRKEWRDMGRRLRALFRETDDCCRGPAPSPRGRRGQEPRRGGPGGGL